MGLKATKNETKVRVFQESLVTRIAGQAERFYGSSRQGMLGTDKQAGIVNNGAIRRSSRLARRERDQKTSGRDVNQVERQGQSRLKEPLTAHHAVRCT